MSLASDLLRARASKLRHAVIEDVLIDEFGKVETTRTHHYLTCVKCKLEKEAQDLDNRERTSDSTGEAV